MEHGRVKKLSNGSLRYEYNISDHLGNTRVSFADTNSDGTAEILQEDHYYAFGLRIEGLSSQNKDNKFTYNGKELEDDHGLNWYHYGARFYDPQIGRWHVVDQVDEFNSPYVYVKNTPVIFIDPDGKKIEVDRILIHNPQIQNDAKGSDFIKTMIFLFGKGGPLYKYDIKVELNKDDKWPEHVDIKLNNAILLPSKNYVQVENKMLYPLEKNGNYSFVMTLYPPTEINSSTDNWNLNSETGPGTITIVSGSVHILYAIKAILEKNATGPSDNRDFYIKLKGDQDGEFSHNDLGYAEGILKDVINLVGLDIKNLPIDQINENTITKYIDIAPEKANE